MAARSTIMDTNSFRPDAASNLDPATLAMTRRRDALLGPAYRLFYRDPVHLVRGEGTYLFDADGHRYLDVYNNVAAVGHAHPRVVDAVSQQLGTLATHTRYLHDAVLDYADDLLGTMPEALNRLMLVCTGSEANDLALRVARVATGGTGVIISSEAYHGNTDLVSQFSPALGSGQPIAPWVRTVPPPDARLAGGADTGAWFAAHVADAIADLERAGVQLAALVVDSIFSSDGVFAEPDVLAATADVVHGAGGVIIADEVQPGLGRTGRTFWGFEGAGMIPDLVTTGKGLGNGVPVAGMAARADLLDAFAERTPYFNTFGGNAVSVTAAQAVLDVIRDDDLQFHADRVGAGMRADLTALAAHADCLGEVRGAGLYTGLEVVDPVDGSPSREIALDIVEALRARRVLTSVCGAEGNVLKLRPPLVFSDDDASWLLTELDAVLREVRR